jgi:hypothetical protein
MKAWMWESDQQQLAPAFGVALTQKDLFANTKNARQLVDRGYRPVKVEIKKTD